jgi:hypothetical protein
MINCLCDARRPNGRADYRRSAFEPISLRLSNQLQTVARRAIIYLFIGGKFEAPGGQMLDPREFRLRHFLLIGLVSVLVAAVLRHTLHVYGHISPKDIGVDALLSAAVIAIAVICLRSRFWR